VKGQYTIFSAGNQNFLDGGQKQPNEDRDNGDYNQATQSGEAGPTPGTGGGTSGHGTNS